MVISALVAILAGALMVVATQQFVAGAATVARNTHVSPVLIGAVILGCGTGLPELALAFQRDHGNPWRELFGVGTDSGNVLLLGFILVLVVILSIPAILPTLLRRHSPILLAATMGFAALLRGSLDIYEGAAMVVGFIFGAYWVVRTKDEAEHDPWSPIIEDDYGQEGPYIEAPVMTPVQAGITRCLVGLLATAVTAQVLAQAVQRILRGAGATEAVVGIAIVIIGSMLPHIVVAIQAVSQHHEDLAVGNLIGSNLFQSLVIGGLVAIIRPYQDGGVISVGLLGIAAATAVVTYMLLQTDRSLSRVQGLSLLFAYLLLVGLAVP